MMKRISYWFLIIVLLFISLLGGIYLWLTYADLSILSHQLEKIIIAKTGQKITIQGGITVQPGIENKIILKEVSLADLPHIKKSVFAKKVILNFALKPLLHGELKCTKAEIIGLQMQVTSATKSADKTTHPVSNEIHNIQGLSLPRLFIFNSRIIYDDKVLNLKKVTLQSLEANNQLSIDLTGTFNKLPLKINTKLKDWQDLTTTAIPLQLKMSVGNLQMVFKGLFSSAYEKITPWLTGELKIKAAQLTDLNPLLNTHLPNMKPVYLQSHLQADKLFAYHLDNLLVKLATVTIEGNIAVKEQNHQPHWQLKLVSNAKNIGALLKQLNLTDGIQGGTLHIETKLSIEGKRWLDLQRSLQGTTNVGIYDATVLREPNANIAKEFISVLAGTNLPSHIPMNCFMADFIMKDGQTKAKAVVFDTKKAMVAGKGTIDLLNKEIDMTLKLYKKGLSITPHKTPFKLKGPLNDPKVVPAIPHSTVLSVVASTVTGVGAIGFLAANMAQNLSSSVVNHDACAQLLKKITDNAAPLDHQEK